MEKKTTCHAFAYTSLFHSIFYVFYVKCLEGYLSLPAQVIFLLKVSITIFVNLVTMNYQQQDSEYCSQKSHDYS